MAPLLPFLILIGFLVAVLGFFAWLASRIRLKQDLRRQRIVARFGHVLAARDAALAAGSIA
ncbi:hypothetical protein [Streptomyces sp. NPDC050704]|uniref:hypothetical protein n=1 Tax=Streptomyces sp. NPDC050704 TaxID=3157219 RepID=UPI00343EACF3